MSRHKMTPAQLTNRTINLYPTPGTHRRNGDACMDATCRHGNLGCENTLTRYTAWANTNGVKVR